MFKTTGLKDRIKSINPYYTLQEKEALLLDEGSSFSSYLKILQPDITPLNEAEAGLLLLIAREKSVSDVIEGMIECKCGTVNDFQIELCDLYDIDFDSSIPIGLFESLDDFCNDSDSIIVKDYNKLQDQMNKNNKKILTLIKEVPCRRCQEAITIGIRPDLYLSKSTLQSIYQEIHNMTFYSHYGYRDIMEMLPFERNILHGLLKKETEKTPQ